MDLAKTNQTSAIGVEKPSCGGGDGVSGDGGRRLSHAMGRKNIETAGATPTCGCQQHASGADNSTSTPCQQRENSTSTTAVTATAATDADDEASPPP